MPIFPERFSGRLHRIAVAACLGALPPAAAAAAAQGTDSGAAQHRGTAGYATATHSNLGHPNFGHQNPGHAATGHSATGHPPAGHAATGRPGTAGHGAGGHGTVSHGGSPHGHPPPPHAPMHGTAGHGSATHRPAARPVPAVVPVPVPAVPAPLPAPPPPQKGASTGLPIPRFAALRADTVNLRSGPGTRYPIQWVYKRRDLPVQVEREFDVWRLVEFADGTKGWVNQATLIGTRTFLVLGDGDRAGGDGTTTAASGAAVPAAVPAAVGVAAVGAPAAASSVAGTLAMRAKPDEAAEVVAMVRPGVVGRIRACAAGSVWCRVSIRDYTGWLPRRALWGLLADETISPP